jgi:phosphoglycolate phosphatase
MSSSENSGRLVIFDVDGTLVDSQHIILAAMRAAFDGVGRAPPPDPEILAIVGLSLPVAVERLAPALDDATRAAITAGYRARFLADRAAGGAEATAPLYPGARAALDAVAALPATRLGVATGKARRGLDHLLATHALGGYFVTTQTADGHPSKPHPSMLRAALAETGCRAGAAVMIGDTDFDIHMGRAAGFATIGVAWGYHPVARLRAAGADRIVADFAEVPAAVASLGAPP